VPSRLREMSVLVVTRRTCWVSVRTESYLPPSGVATQWVLRVGSAAMAATDHVCQSESRQEYPTIQPFSQKSLTATVPNVFQIGLCGVVEADLELFCNSWSVGFLGERLFCNIVTSWNMGWRSRSRSSFAALKRRRWAFSVPWSVLPSAAGSPRDRPRAVLGGRPTFDPVSSSAGLDHNLAIQYSAGWPKPPVCATSVRVFSSFQADGRRIPGKTNGAKMYHGRRTCASKRIHGVHCEAVLFSPRSLSCPQCSVQREGTQCVLAHCSLSTNRNNFTALLSGWERGLATGASGKVPCSSQDGILIHPRVIYWRLSVSVPRRTGPPRRVIKPVPVRAPRCSALIDFGPPFPGSGQLQYVFESMSNVRLPNRRR